jgi:hypothetical protein
MSAVSVHRLALLGVMLLLLPGCINIFAMTAKLVKGEPEIPSAFQRQTGESLQKGEKTVALVCDAPQAILDEYDSLAVDLQEELLRRMRLRGMEIADMNRVMSALEGTGGGFSPAAIANDLDVAYIIHVQLEGYSDVEPGSANMYRGRAQGLVRAFRVQGEPNTPQRRIVEVFQNDFNIEYPATHPVPADQTGKRTFQHDFLDRLADEIGRRFYDVTVAETI